MDGEERSPEALSVAKAAGASSAAVQEGGRRSGPMAFAKIAVVLLVLAGLVAWLLTSSSEVFVYSHTVAEVMADPDAFAGRTLRAEGDLVDGTLEFRENPCDYHFTLSGGEQRMPVDFPECIVPDTFREGMGITVVVEGRLGADGTFHASDVIPRCPSRYEMDERAGRGETMPHALPAAPSPTPR